MPYIRLTSNKCKVRFCVFIIMIPCCRSGSPVSRKSVSGSEAGSPTHGKGSGEAELSIKTVTSFWK